MKFLLIPFLFCSALTYAQGWEADAGLGVSGYNGDLSQKALRLSTLRPGAVFNVRYNIDNTFILRAGVSWLNVYGDDKYNTQANLKNRNLNFRSTIWEGSICAEVNLLEPEFFYSYPYLFAGIGVMHFNPYTFDKDHVKTFLQPLGTEGQGLASYPKRKPYKLLQLCLPVGGGWKFELNKKYDIVYELGYRFIFSDYLDDVSTNYINPNTLLQYKGPKAVELAYRQDVPPNSGLPVEGDIRGNPKVKDGYFFTGIKLLIHLGRDKEQ